MCVYLHVCVMNILCVFVCACMTLACVCVCACGGQEYSEEFRDISSKGRRLGGSHIPEGSITLLNQRTVGEDLPVWPLHTFTHSHTLPLSLSSIQYHTLAWKVLFLSPVIFWADCCPENYCCVSNQSPHNHVVCGVIVTCSSSPILCSQ